MVRHQIDVWDCLVWVGPVLKLEPETDRPIDWSSNEGKIKSNINYWGGGGRRALNSIKMATSRLKLIIEEDEIEPIKGKINYWGDRAHQG